MIAQLPAQKTATELMTKTVFCVAPDDSMEEACPTDAHASCTCTCTCACTRACFVHLHTHTHTHTTHAVQARLKMLRVNKKSTPVVDADGKFAGTLKYNAVVKAVKAGKAAQMVKAWMRREGVTVAPDTPFDGVQPRLVLPCTYYVLKVYSLSTHRLLTMCTDLERVMESEGAGRLPVVSDDGILLGLVTRTDVLRERKLYASVGGTGQRRVR